MSVLSMHYNQESPGIEIILLSYDFNAVIININSSRETGPVDCKNPLLNPVMVDD